MSSSLSGSFFKLHDLKSSYFSLKETQNPPLRKTPPGWWTSPGSPRDNPTGLFPPTDGGPIGCFTLAAEERREGWGNPGWELPSHTFCTRGKEKALGPGPGHMLGQAPRSLLSKKIKDTSVDRGHVYMSRDSLSGAGTKPYWDSMGTSGLPRAATEMAGGLQGSYCDFCVQAWCQQGKRQGPGGRCPCGKNRVPTSKDLYQHWTVGQKA